MVIASLPDPSTPNARFEVVVEQFLREREADRKKPEEQAEVLVLEKPSGAQKRAAVPLKPWWGSDHSPGYERAS